MTLRFSVLFHLSAVKINNTTMFYKFIVFIPKVVVIVNKNSITNDTVFFTEHLKAGETVVVLHTWL